MTIAVLCITVLKLPFQDRHAVPLVAEGLPVATCLYGGNPICFRLAHVPYALCPGTGERVTASMFLATFGRRAGPVLCLTSARDLAQCLVGAAY